MREQQGFRPDVVLPTGQTCAVAADTAQLDVVWTVGTITLACGILAAVVSYTARERCRVHLNDLGKKDARPVPREEYDRIRTSA